MHTLALVSGSVCFRGLGGFFNVRIYTCIVIQWVLNAFADEGTVKLVEKFSGLKGMLSRYWKNVDSPEKYCY